MAQPGVQLDGERELLLVPARETSISLWPLAAICAVLLVVSFVVANAIAWWLQVRRERRIARKTATLAGATSADGGSVVPVTVLTGFLGAGKTTLLNRILHTPDVPFKVMVLENELGAISIDHTLLQAGKDADVQDQDAIVVLQNGCMCCMARGNRRGSELERIVDYLLRLVNEKGFDYLVVETSGLADPGPIIETFLRLRASRFRLDSIVAMVDARAAQRYYSPSKASYKFPVELQRQLLYADIVALNKVDLADREEVQRLHAGVAAINEEATVYECANAELNLSHIIGVDTFDAVKFREALSTADSAQIVAHGIHSDGVSTVHFEVVASVALPRFSEWLAQVVERYAKADILRIKGVLAVAGEDARCVVQCVLDTYTMAPSRAWGSQERRASKLVVIGQGLDREQLERGFRRCLVGVDGDDGDDNNEADAIESKKQR